MENQKLENLAKRTGFSLNYVKFIAGLVPDECLYEALIDPVFKNTKDYLKENKRCIIKRLRQGELC